MNQIIVVIGEYLKVLLSGEGKCWLHVPCVPDPDVRGKNNTSFKELLINSTSVCLSKYKGFMQDYRK